MTQQLAPTDSSPRTWGAGAWVVLGVAIAAELALCVPAIVLVVFGASASCGTEPALSDVRAGEGALSVVLAVGLVPWAVAVALSRYKLRLAVAAAVAMAPVLVAMVAGLRPEFWGNGFCF